MAEKATLLVVLKDQATKGLKGLSRAMDFVKRNAIAITGAFTTLSVVIAKSVQAFIRQDNASRRAAEALRLAGDSSKESLEDLKSWAAGLQQVNNVSDETSLELFALAQSFLGTTEASKKAVQAAQELAVVADLQLTEALRRIGRSASGSTEDIAKFAPEINKLTKEQLAAGEAADVLLRKFGGAAAAQAETFGGKIEKLKNRFGDFMELIGQEFLPVLDLWINKANKVLGVLERLISSTEDNLSVDEAALKKLRKRQEVLSAELRIKTKAMEFETTRFKKLKQEFEANQRLIEQTKERIALAEQESAAKAGEVQAPNIDEEKQAKLVEQANKEIALLTQTSEEKRSMALADLAFELTLIGEKDKALQILNAKRLSDEKKQQALRWQGTKASLSRIASLASAKNKQLAAIGKAGAIAQATMDTYAAANVALKSAPPPFNFALAAGVVAAGIANVAKITGTPLAEGGVVLPRSGGTLATIGEAGKAEAVIPLDDPEARERIGGFGGESVNITINANAFMGDEAQAAEFAKMIDEELFKLGRNRQRVSD